MFGGSMMRGFEDDPFFDMHRQHMDHMNRMMMNPFGAMGNPAMAIADGREQQRDHQRRGQRSRNEVARRQVSPFGGSDVFGDMFGNMNRMMSNMRGMMNSMDSNMMQPQVVNQPGGNFYSQSSVMTYSNDGRNQPKVYQATTSTRQAGGVKETRRTMKDSEKGVEKIAIGQQIGEKSRVITKERNKRTGDMVENTDLVNLDEDDVDHFEDEWRHKTNSNRHHPHHHHHQRSGQHRSLGYTPSPVEGHIPKRNKINHRSSVDGKKVKFYSKK